MPRAGLYISTTFSNPCVRDRSSLDMDGCEPCVLDRSSLDMGGGTGEGGRRSRTQTIRWSAKFMGVSAKPARDAVTGTRRPA